jgi:hypothetical protein
MNFPNSPTLNQVYSFGGRSWTWNGTAWLQNASTLLVPISSGGTGNTTGNAATVTNGVYTTGDQTIGGNKIFGNYTVFAGTSPAIAIRDTDSTGAAQIGRVLFQNSGNVDQAWVGYGSTGNTDFNIQNNQGTVTIQGQVALNATNYNSYAPTLTGTGASGSWGISVTGNAATVTNGVYTTGDQTLAGNKTFTDSLLQGYSTPVAGGFYSGGGTSHTAIAQIHGGPTLRGSLGLFNWVSGSFAHSSLSFNKSNSDSPGTRVLVTASGTDLGSIAFAADTGTIFRSAAYIRALLDATGSASSMPGRLSFGTSDAAGTVVERLRIDSAGQQSSVIPGGSTLYPEFKCRSWVNFNGQGTTGANQTIRASGNVTSIFKNGTGDYTLNFTTAMPDANYAITGYCVYNAAPAGGNISNGSTYTMTTTQARFITANSNNGSAFDSVLATVAIFR